LEAGGDAAVLIPFVVGLVLWGSTAIVSLAVALVRCWRYSSISRWAKPLPSRVSLLDGHLRTFPHLRAMVHGPCANVQAFG